MAPGTLRLTTLAVCAFALVLLWPGQPAQAKRLVGTNGADRLVGTPKRDLITARGGNDLAKGLGRADIVRGGTGKDRVSGGNGRDRVSGDKGRDRVSGGKGRDRVSGRADDDFVHAADGKADRRVNGGAGNDYCTIDNADVPVTRNCENAKVAPDTPGGLRVTSSSGLVCGTALPLCPFQIVGRGADGLLGLASGGGGVTLAAGARVSITGDTWTATGLYGCSSDGEILVTIGSESARVPITCTA
ncbi:MAG: hypothetical protein H0W09_05145 [Solirubrobacterales bacterium]|nr:hypothetical protein [Solirubrobacterales bacterium]